LVLLCTASAVLFSTIEIAAEKNAAVLIDPHQKSIIHLF
jgi:hypothetical protein